MPAPRRSARRVPDRLAASTSLCRKIFVGRFRPAGSMWVSTAVHLNDMLDHHSVNSIRLGARRYLVQRSGGPIPKKRQPESAKRVWPDVPFNADICGMVIGSRFGVRQPYPSTPTYEAWSSARALVSGPPHHSTPGFAVTFRAAFWARWPTLLVLQLRPANSNAKVNPPTLSTATGPSQPNPIQGRLTPELSGRPHNAGLGAVLAANRGDILRAWTSMPEHV